ncbi:hypothetical protein GCM10027521_02720 [Amycolatopsis cihanbeyliensis]
MYLKYCLFAGALLLNTPDVRQVASVAIGDTERRLATARRASERRTTGRQRVRIEWRLRKVMASRDVWTATQLRDLLIQRAGFELSLQSVDVLIKRQPVQVKVATLQALCTTLRCTPNELFGIDTPRDVSLVELDDSESGGER